MFWHLLMAIFNLYMKTLFVSSYTKHIYMGLGGGKVGMRSCIWSDGWMVWVAWRVHAVTKLRLSLL